MTNVEIALRRLHNQHLAGTGFGRPEDVVSWLGAVQAQDYPGAKWAVAQRTHGATDAIVERVFAAGAVLRVHIMRPTWHFVVPADIRWMRGLTAPGLRAASSLRYRQLGLDDSIFARSNAVLERALRDGKQVTRGELDAIFRRAGIISATDDRQRLPYLLIRGELDGVICSGALRGKQHTYALFEERVPEARPIARDEALAKLAGRYFTSHGPATVRDFGWWSGLPASDAKAGLEMCRSQLTQEVREGQTYWFAPNPLPTTGASPAVFLLPAFDEYTIAYQDQRGMLDLQTLKQVGHGLTTVIVIDGRIAGIWKRSFDKGTVVITASPFAPLSEAEGQALALTAQRYGRFLNMPVALAWGAVDRTR